MRRVSGTVVAVFSAVFVLAGCGNKPKVIPPDKLADIYAEIFMADKWATRDNYTRRVADSCLLYEPIFNRYGYTFRDYNASVHHYLEKPDSYSKILKNAAAKLDRERVALEKVEEKAKAIVRFKPYRKTDFPADSLLLRDTTILWNAPLPAVDTTAAADTLAVADTLAAADTFVERKKSIDRRYDRRKDTVGVLRRDGLDHAALRRYEPVR